MKLTLPEELNHVGLLQSAITGQEKAICHNQYVLIKMAMNDNDCSKEQISLNVKNHDLYWYYLYIVEEMENTGFYLLPLCDCTLDVFTVAIYGTMFVLYTISNSKS